MKPNKLFIAIDGPAASGKGTIAKLLGKKLNLPILHTGNIYRAIAYKIWQAGLDPKNLETSIAFAKDLKASDLDNNDLNLEQIGEYASIIASYPQVRDVTYSFQRDFIDKSNGAIIEGRDIGTVICPEANLKFYIIADVEVRAKRRLAQINGDYDVVLKDLRMRDQRDQNRVTAPLKPALDAIIIDTSYLTANETLETILDYILKLQPSFLNLI